MKKLIALLLVLSFLCSNFAFQTVFADTVYSGHCGSESDGTNVRWNFDESTGTLSITGYGTMKNWRHQTIYDMFDPNSSSLVYSYTPWFEFRDKILHASISDGITTMGDFTFGGCKNLKDVKLGKDLTNIGVGGFETCTSLVSINIPSKVVYIDVGAFYNATKLSSVFLPDGLKAIHYGAFAQCYDLKSISLPATVNQINAGAFARTGISSIVLPEGVQGISKYTFYQCTKLQSVKFLGQIKYINEGAFAGCTNSMFFFRIPDTCTSIEPLAFTESNHTVRLYCYAGSYGETYCKENIPTGMYFVIEHDFKKQSVISPTCTERGYTVYYCRECDGYRSEDYTDALGHDMSGWSISSVATPDKEGELVCACGTCNLKDYKAYPYHTPGDVDLDEELTVYDIIVLLQQMAGIKEFDEYALSAGDINLNYAIDTEDATLLLQRVCGSSVEFPSEHPELFRL